MNDINYVVIQAGGVGSRMGSYTNNKPKCMVSYNNKPIIQHTLDYFSDKKIFIICDYKKELLKTYITDILKYDVTFIEPKEKSTTSGLKELYDLIPDNEGFVYLWSDLILTKKIDFFVDKNIDVFLTNDLLCRWSVTDGKMVKVNNDKNGIAGLFVFKNKNIIKDLNSDVSFVGGNLINLNQHNVGFKYVEGLMEIGTEEFYEKLILDSNKCRFFNEVKITDNVVYKKCIDNNYSSLIDNEINWYLFLNTKNFINFIPNLISESPFCISKIDGNHVFELSLTYKDKQHIIESIIDNLNKLHSISTIRGNNDDLIDVYQNKTLKRVLSVKDIIPYYENEIITINGYNCKNPFNKKHLESFINSISFLFINEYHVIHGDPTFSNLLIDTNNKSYFIDPRGIFGKTKIYGDKNYDWAKLFYSVNGNYDSINSKKFNVKFDDKNIVLDIKSNGFEEFSDLIIQKSGMSKDIMNLHQSLIWLSLTGYVKEDYDAILYSFYYGILLWNLSQG
jgi:GTP:adenosylcobinamide-phosphate guanylyltransferase